MSRRPLIGITCSSALPTDGQPAHDRLNHAYSHAIWACGGTPVIVANVAGQEHAAELLARLDGLLLSGGNDVAPGVYGEAILNDTVCLDEPRDGSELPLIRLAATRGTPILAICRGIQSLNVALGGTLYQDLPAQRPSEVRHRQTEARDAATHDVAIEPGSLLAHVVGPDPLPVNSFHHQAVRDTAPGLRTVARAADGVIEAMEDPSKPFVLAVQFHPEEMYQVSARCRMLFEALVAACRSG